MFGRRKKNKKLRLERFESLSANGAPIEAINFALTRNSDGSPRLEVRTPDVCEALHYESIGFELKTTVKRVTVQAKFKEAVNEKHFKLYIFDVEDCKQYFI